MREPGAAGCTNPATVLGSGAAPGAHLVSPPCSLGCSDCSWAPRSWVGLARGCEGPQELERETKVLEAARV